MFTASLTGKNNRIFLFLIVICRKIFVKDTKIKFICQLPNKINFDDN